jgi:L-lactate utilization protein LutB
LSGPEMNDRAADKPRSPMADPLERYWKHRLENCRKALARNNFAVFLADTPDEARDLILREILPQTGARTVSWGDSLTLHATGVLDRLKLDPDFQVLETFDDRLSREVLLERRRQALLVDVFLTGTNAVTETGTLVNLDMIGNRVGAITFGPKHVIITVGRNKIVPGLAEAMNRVKHYAAPINVMRHPGFKAPCAKTGHCTDCHSPDRICNVWTITEKSWPKERIKVVLINRDLGL